MPKLKRRTPEFTSVPTRPSSRPSTTMAIAFTSEPRASTTAAIRPHTISEKYSAGPNCSAIRASGGAATTISSVAHGPGEERAHRGNAERRSGASLPRHLMAVDGGDDGRSLARDVDQDGGGRAAVLGAVVDAGEQDQRRFRHQRERDRQQHRHCGHRADAGQHADDGAEQHADEAIGDVLQRQRDGKSHRRDWRTRPSATYRLGQIGSGRPSA